MSILLPESLNKPFKGILFDLDGTLIDSEELHYEAFKTALKEYGYDIDSIGDIMQYSGSFRKMFEAIAKKFHLADDIFEEIYQRKVEITLELPANTVEAIDGMVSYLEYLKEKGVALGVVTNSEQAYVDHVMSGFDLLPYFDHVVHGEHVANPKPAPDGYLRGLDLLGLSANDVLAFENTDSGILAAKAAGLPVVAIRSTDHLGTSTYEQSDHQIDDFTDNSIDELMFYERD